MKALPRQPINDVSRLRTALMLSLLLHTALVLGLSFSLDEAAPVTPTLDVIFTETTSPLTQSQADFLAQASNQGGGEHEQARRPRESQLGAAPHETPGIAPEALRAQSPDARPPPQARVVSSAAGAHRVTTPDPTPQADPSLLPRGPDRIERDMEMARLAAEIHLRSEAYAKRPKRKFVSASTQEYAYATYLRQWVDRVERVGNLNYPDEARQRGLAGELVISIAIRRDGSVEGARLIRSSGIPLLDDAALRIARLAEPYAPLPPTEENIDILHVTRTWQFLPAGALVDG
ncbi:energy transducer TonB [Luteimonas abyssi]|uniref:energy transducer TonB n=1 Tax=Luteimonas abyssi TaxID=1247514 RepID=UPI000737BCBA|nr:energy transducer TonB [Luteimonas abyssi]